MGTNRQRRRLTLAAGIGTLTALLGGTVAAQSELFQFVVAASDAAGRPITSLARDEVLMTEDGLPNQIVKVEPFRVPVELTIAVDNGPLSREALSHYRAGLTGLVNALPRDVEVTIISISPQPRTVAGPTTDRQQLLRGVNGFAPQDDSPRFTDALVEFASRYRTALEAERRIDSLPELVMVSTSAVEAVSYEVPEISRAIEFLRARKARVYVTMMTSREGEGIGFAPLNTARQTLIAIPVTEATGGRYEPLATASGLRKLLPDFGREIAALHATHVNQFLVTAQRRDGLSGPLRNPRIELARPGLTGQVSLDGLP